MINAQMKVTRSIWHRCSAAQASISFVFRFKHISFSCALYSFSPLKAMAADEPPNKKQKIGLGALRDSSTRVPLVLCARCEKILHPPLAFELDVDLLWTVGPPNIYCTVQWCKDDRARERYGMPPLHRLPTIWIIQRLRKRRGRQFGEEVLANLLDDVSGNVEGNVTQSSADLPDTLPMNESSISESSPTFESD